MGKGFMKFRMSRVISTFHSCRSKDPSTLPSNPVPSFLHHNSSSSSTTIAATAHRKLNTNTPSPHPKPHRSSIKRHVSSAILSARHGWLRPRPSPEPSHTRSPPPPPSSSSSSSKQRSHHHHHFKWGKISSNNNNEYNHPHWHVIAKIPSPDHDHQNYDSTPPRRKIYTSAASDTDRENDVVFLPTPPSKTHRSKTTTSRRRKRRTSSHKSRISTSSDSGLFSDDDDNDFLERETLVSTTDSPKSKERETKQPTTTTMKRRSSFDSLTMTSSSPVPARLSEFMRKMTPCKSVANGKVRESFAMVKKSEDPYEDFKRSMVEMVVEKQMFEERELEELLRCFLSLNSERHHDVIVTVFTQIWKSLFSDQDHQLPSPH